jgi:hypothetical protein
MKTHRMSIKEFMQGKESYNRSKQTALFGGLLPLSVAPLLGVPQASAATYDAVQAVPAVSMTSDQIYDKMLTAFEPVTTLIQALAYPVASIVVLVGAIMVMINRKDKGFDMMSSAALGIILVNLLPMLLNMLVEIMKGIV